MNVKEIREKCYLTQKEFAEKLNVNTQTISCWERGVRKPSLKHKRVIAQICKENNIILIRPPIFL